MLSWYWGLSNRHEWHDLWHQERTIFGGEKLLLRRTYYSTTLKHSFLLLLPFCTDQVVIPSFSFDSALPPFSPTASLWLKEQQSIWSLSVWKTPSKKKSLWALWATAKDHPIPSNDSPYILCICEYLEAILLANESVSPVFNCILVFQGWAVKCVLHSVLLSSQSPNEERHSWVKALPPKI